MVLCSIADRRSLEESAHLGGTVLQAAHVGNQAGLESPLVPWRAATRHRLLEIVVEEFIGIALGRVGRQIVDDDKQLACRLADQAAQEIEKDRRLEGALIDHEAQLALVGQAGNHRLRKALARSPDDWGVPDRK